jgi:hypothetical protein
MRVLEIFEEAYGTKDDGNDNNGVDEGKVFALIKAATQEEQQTIELAIEKQQKMISMSVNANVNDNNQQQQQEKKRDASNTTEES